MKTLRLLTLLLLFGTVHAQGYRMGSTRYLSTCAANFFDSGGQVSDYSNGESSLMTFCASSPNDLYANFTSFKTQVGDTLFVYNGRDSLAPVLAAFTGNLIPSMIVSDNQYNCLTFRFKSNAIGTSTGWAANVTCWQPNYEITPCQSARLLCLDSVIKFPAPVNRASFEGPEYGCLITQPNSIWFKLPIAQPGNISLESSSSNNEDIDFIVWGPYTSGQACMQLTNEKIVDCSYAISGVDTIEIANAEIGQTYILCITNYSNDSTDITIRSNIDTGAATNCNAEECYIGARSYNFSNCDSNAINLWLSLHLNAPANSGPLVIVNSYGDTSFIAPPFNDVVVYTGSYPAYTDTLGIKAYFANNLNCIYNAQYVVDIGAPISMSTTVIPVNVGEHNGHINLSVQGGSSQYSYIWSNGATSYILSGLYPGLYTVTVTDYMGCTATTAVQVSQVPCSLTLNADAYFCQQGGQGYYADVHYTMVNAPLQGNLVLQLGNSTYNVSPPYSANNYTYTTGGIQATAPVYVTGYFSADTGCRYIDTAQISNRDLAATLSTTHASNQAQNNGTVATNISAGGKPYTYKWSNGWVTPSINGLVPGTYTVTITDARGCQLILASEVESTLVGISEAKNSFAFSVTPNPATTQLRFEFANAFSGKGSLYGTDGKLFDIFAINNQTETLNIAGLPAGVYIIHIKDNATNATSYTRVVKY